MQFSVGALLSMSQALGSTCSNTRKNKMRQVWWHTSIIPVFQTLRKEDGEYKATLSYIASSRSVWAT
jgi:hypothetical protein